MGIVARYIGKAGANFLSNIGSRMANQTPTAVKLESFKEYKGKAEPAESKAEEVDGDEVQNVALSDENLKQIYGENINDSLVEDFAKIGAIDFTYKPEAVEEYDGKFSVDDKQHIGVTAQNLEEVDATRGAVKENEEGDKVVDTNHLVFSDTAAIGELSRRVIALEEVVKELTQKLKEKELQ